MWVDCPGGHTLGLDHGCTTSRAVCGFFHIGLQGRIVRPDQQGDGLVLWAPWGVVVGLVILALSAWPLVRRLARSARARRLVKARNEFRRHREYVEAKFVDLASKRGKPRGLLWGRCDFDDDVAYVRDRRTGALSALVGVTIGFEAEIGGGMEDVEAVGDLRAATAVFDYRGAGWTTRGHVLFNLNPVEAVDFYHRELEMIAHEIPARL